MKKVLSVILTLLLVLTIAQVRFSTVSALQQSGVYTYTIVGSTATITGYTGTGGAVTIPSTLGTLGVYMVTSIGNAAFEGCTGLTRVTIPASVTSIRDDVFDGCTGLTGVTIGSSVISIGSSAFEGCKGL